LGVGSATDGDNVAVFLVVEWPEVASVREELGLPPSDTHITLGFKRSDVHGCAKDATTLLAGDESQIDALADKLASVAVTATSTATRATAKARGKGKKK